MNSSKVPVTLCCECNNIPVKWRCPQCNDLFCETCYDKVHSAGVTLKKHKKEPFDELDKKFDDEVMCDNHPGQIFEYYCEQCSQYSCKICLEKKHLDHTYVTIGQKNTEIFQEFSDAYDEASSVLLQLKGSKKKFNNGAHFKDTESQKVQQEVSVHYNHLHGLLQLQEEEFMNKIKLSEDRTQNSLQQVYQELEETIQELENVISESRRWVQSETLLNVPIFHTLEKLKNLSESPCHIVLNKENDNTTYRFFVGSNVEEMIKGHCTVTVPNNRVYELRTKSKLPDDYILEHIPDTRKRTLKRPDSSNVCLEDKKFKEPVPPLKLSKPLNRNVPNIQSKLGVSAFPDLLQKDVPKKVTDDSVSVTSADSDLENTFNISPLKEGSSEMVRICHLISPNDFYIQRDSCNEQLMKLGNYFSKRANIKGKKPHSIELGHIYLVQFRDKKWYRAVAKKIAGNTCEIFYIDYGNTETVAKDSLREIPEKFSRIPPIAVHCSLFGCAPNEQEWSPDVIALMAHLSNSVDLIMHVVRVDVAAGFYEVTLSRYDESGGSLGDTLIFLGVAYRVDDSLSGFNNYEHRSSKLYKYTNISVKKGEKFDGQITHINTPTNFYLQKVNDGGKRLNDLTKDINFFYSQLQPNEQLVFNPVIGSAVAARYGDGDWYRAQIIGVPKPMYIEVQYVDFGNIDTVPYSNLRLMQPKFMKVGIQALKCKLSDIAPKKDKGWSVSATKEFQNLAKKNLVYTVYVDEVTETHLSIILYERQLYKQIVINGVLVRRGHAKSVGINSAQAEYALEACIDSDADYSTNKSYATNQLAELPSNDGNLSISSGSSSDAVKPSPDDSERIKVKIIKYISPDEIYVTFEHVIKQIIRLNEEMTNYYNVIETEGINWNKGDLCAVRKADKKWYRGVIVDSVDSIYKVLIKDIMEFAHVDAADLRTLHSSFKTVMDGAFRCHLCAILPAGGSKAWSASSYDFMRERFSSFPDLYLKNLGCLEDNNSLPVQLWAKFMKTGGPLDPIIEDWKDLSQDLVDCGFALPNKNSPYYSALKRNNNDTGVTDWHRYVYEVDLSSLTSTQDCKRGKNNQRKRQEPPRTKVTDKNIFESFDKLSFSNLSTPPPRKQTVDWKPALPFSRLNFVARPTNVDYGCGIYIQDVETSKQTLEMIQRGMATLHEGSSPKPHDDLWFKGQICIALYGPDEKWYRAKVTDILEEEIEVLFVDYGNKDTVPRDHLRKQICMEEVPIQCRRCVFRGMSPISENGEWPEKVLDSIHVALVDQECQVQLLPPEKEGGDYIIEQIFLPGGEEFKSILHDMHYVTYSVDNRCWKQTKTSDVDLIPVSEPLSIEEETKRDTHNPDVLDYLDKLPGPQNKPYVNDWFEQLQILPEANNIGSYRDWVLPERLIAANISILSIHKIFKILFHIESCDDPEVMEMIEEFKVLHKQVENYANNQPKLVEPTKGQACVACFTEDDVWYRAVITNVFSNDTVQLYYVDYGNEEVLSTERLRETKEEWMALPSQAICATLHNVDIGPHYDVGLCQRLMSTAFSSPPYVMSIERRQPDLEVDIFGKTGELTYQSIINANILIQKVLPENHH